MSNAAIDLWPEMIGQSEEKPPVVILREQAALLGSKTANIVETQVSPGVALFTPLRLAERSRMFQFAWKFDLTAAALGGYRYDLFQVFHDLPYYPVFIKWRDPDLVRCDNETELVEQLRGIFGHAETLRVIQALVTQASG